MWPYFNVPKKGMSTWVVVVELQISNFSAISWREHDSVGWNEFLGFFLQKMSTKCKMIVFMSTQDLVEFHYDLFQHFFGVSNNKLYDDVDKLMDTGDADYTGSCKSNYHMIMAKTAPVHKILIKHKIWPILINYLLLHVSVKFKEEYIIFIITRIH
jgi:hypothetical protein